MSNNPLCTNSTHLDNQPLYQPKTLKSFELAPRPIQSLNRDVREEAAAAAKMLYCIKDIFS